MFGIDKEKRFWKWFEKNNSKFLFINEVEPDIKEQHLNEFLRELHRVNDRLYFLIGGHPDNKKVELIITPEGIKELFPVVEQLVSKAPELHDWEIIAFKPAQGAGFVTEFGGRKFDPKEIDFIPLDNQDDPSLVGIQVIYPDFTNDERDIFFAATYQVIDTLIGERSTTLDIDYLDITVTPEETSELTTLKLTELENFISKKKNAG
ncbi:hypothetical protein [Ekhidna sp.]|uniref:hypothetical protein n=1 Tax=Ekhidna sp. TaxID=2608089 RepID=UPI003297F943